MTRQKLLFLPLLLFFLSLLFCSEAAANHTFIKIGVLAKRGEARALEQWGPTAEYLNWMLPDYHFKIVPLDFKCNLSLGPKERSGFYPDEFSFLCWTGLSQ